ncbi:MAG: sulfatase-like hydrolase/transferase [Lachnospiraceae bacterium]|nr:sulfatase-like hydrolase/transferase [Lachnospiraceae bacterium]
MYIYLLILLLAVISAATDRLLYNRHGEIIKMSAVYAVLYHYLIVLVRTVTSDGSNFLSFSFNGKTLMGYGKAAVIPVATYIFIFVARKIEDKRGKDKNLVASLLAPFSAIQIALEVLYVIFIQWPTMRQISLMGIATLLLLILYYVIKGKRSEGTISKTDKRDRIIITVSLLLYSALYVLVGPTELMAYNRSDFIFSYKDAIVYLIFGTLMIAVPASVIIPKYLGNKVTKLFSLVVSLYCILSLIQAFFLNGKMNIIDGGTQEWDEAKTVINVVIWLVVFLVGVIILLKKGKNGNIIKWISIYILAIQTVTLIYVLLTTGVMKGSARQLTEDGCLTLSKENNVVVFVLDAYDVQMLKHVTDDDPDYLAPLHDFTYYDNMVSRYTATDGSLPYLLTGANLEDHDIEQDQNLWYENTHFLKDIMNAGYDIRILTDKCYVEPLSDDVVTNFSDDNYCILDMDKTLALFTKCMRYKNMPFLLKPRYKYEAYDITNVVTDTNIYVFGTDADFDDKIFDKGIDTDCQNEAFRIYHLYGAHSPYYLTEDAELDYGSNAMAQWRGSIKIVYDYMDALKEAGIYDKTTLIIMADHGFNDTQRKSVAAEGLAFDESKTNPIFFIKRAGETKEQLTIDSRATSHDVFFDTIRECMGLEREYYGSVWEY